jgi:nucleotide-binding universal stress UspA family protein
MKRILIPTDFSEGAQWASDYALQIAAKTRAEILYLHVLITPIDWRDLPKDKESLYPETQSAIAHAKDKLQKLEQEAQKQGVNAKSRLAFNLNRENIVERANSGEYDLVVIGSHGASGFKKFAVGSNALSLIRNAEIPVIIIKNKAEKPLPENVTFASTFESSQKPHFNQLLKFSKELGASLDLLHINTPYRFFETIEMDSIMFDFVEDLSSGITIHSINARNEIKGVEDFVETNETDMIALVTRGKSVFAQLFVPSVTEDLVAKLEIPVLSLRLKD